MVVEVNTTVMPEEGKSMMWYKHIQCKTSVDDSYEGDHHDVALSREGDVLP